MSNDDNTLKDVTFQVQLQYLKKWTTYQHTYYIKEGILNYQAQKETLAYTQWINLQFGFSHRASQINYYFNAGLKTYQTNTQSFIHPSIACFFQFNFNSGNSRYVVASELKFWSVPPASYNQNFADRFYGISFKYLPYNSPWLMEYFVTQKNGAFNWTGTLLNTTVTNIDSKIPVWQDDSSNEVFLCPPGYQYQQTYGCTNSNLCTNNCYECSYQSKSKCYSCKQNYFYISSTFSCILLDIPKGQYFDTDLANYQNCQSPCTTCLNKTHCTFCISTYKYVDDGSYTCIPITQSCPSNTYDEPNGYPICKACPKGCQTCSDQTTCTKCISGYTLLNGKCEIQCPGSSLNTTSGNCVACSANCSSCLSTGCNYCHPGFYMESGKCLPNCTVAGTYENVESRTCMKCQVNCKSCYSNNYTCTACQPGYYLLNTSCVQRCPYMGYFQNTVNNTCDPCDPQCQICINSITDCISCQPNVKFSNRTCGNSCAYQYYSSPSGQCYPCDISCQVCNGSLNSNCQKCTAGYYLLNQTCDSTCPKPYYQNATSRECLKCKYYCDGCTTKYTCYQCKPGYPQIIQNCSGEYFLKTSSNYTVNLPINTGLMTAAFEPTQMTAEIWFKADDITTSDLQVILGMSPYKMRKKAGSKIIQINYQGMLNYCDTSDTLNSDQWYHFAFSIAEDTHKLECFLDGQSVNVGTNPTILISTNVVQATELILGGTLDPKGSEVNFQGYIKEFRYWKVARSAFQIANFRNVAFNSTSLSNFLAYWRLDEVNDGTVSILKDSASSGSVSFDPRTLITPAKTVQEIMEFREIHLKLCPEGQYANYNSNGYYECQPCNSLCKNCIGPDIKNCTECYTPYKFYQEEFSCVIVESCPDGTYMDSVTGLCYKCNQYCTKCISQSNYCQACKYGSFKEYKGTDCVASCPSGMYGNYKTQLCYANPVVDYLKPEDDSVFNYGTFIEGLANFTLLNNEPSSTISYGWIITRQKGMIDITNDVIKTYYQTDIRKVHFDNNILQSNNYYNISFYVKGDSFYYKGLYTIVSNIIYIGMPPINGKCIVYPLQGIANVTSFNITQSGWQDRDSIAIYEFFYSMDGGDVYLPLNDADFSLTSIEQVFMHIYNKYLEVKIKCKATNSKGFSNQLVTTITLEKKSNANSQNDLTKFNTNNIDTEAECLENLQKLKLIAENLGSLQPVDPYIFDPKIEGSACNNQTCNDNGICNYISYNKKYYCSCVNQAGGQNCTFSNATQLQKIKDNAQKISEIYSLIMDKKYEFEFLKLITSYRELITDTSF